MLWSRSEEPDLIQSCMTGTERMISDIHQDWPFKISGTYNTTGGAGISKKSTCCYSGRKTTYGQTKIQMGGWRVELC